MSVVLIDVYLLLLCLMPVTALFMRLGWGQRDGELIYYQRIQDLVCHLLAIGLSVAAVVGYDFCWGIALCVAAGYCIHRSRLPLLKGQHPRRFILAAVGLLLSLACFIPLLYVGKTGDAGAAIGLHEESARKAVYRALERMLKKPPSALEARVDGLFSGFAPYKVRVHATKTWDNKDSFYISAIPVRYGKERALRFGLFPSLNDRFFASGTSCYVLEVNGVLLAKDSGGVLPKSREELKTWRVVQTRKDQAPKK
jgi:hypothetical protein